MYVFSQICQQAGASNELYWAMGDGGPQEDTTNNGQNTNTLHGSIMRISVDSQMDSSYSVPGSNPYSGGGKSRLVAPVVTLPWC